MSFYKSDGPLQFKYSTSNLSAPFQVLGSIKERQMSCIYIVFFQSFLTPQSAFTMPVLHSYTGGSDQLARCRLLIKRLNHSHTRKVLVRLRFSVMFKDTSTCYLQGLGSNLPITGRPLYRVSLSRPQSKNQNLLLIVDLSY